MSDASRSTMHLGEVGAAFREARRRKNLTQQALSARSGVSRDTIHRLEHGSAVDLSSLTALLAAMGLRLEFAEAPRLDAAEMRRRFAHIHEEDQS